MIPTAPPAVPTLYHVPSFCSSIPYHAALELSIPRTKLAVTTITRTTLRTDPTIPAFSPGRVAPFLVLPTGETMLEAGAILLYVCEQFDISSKLHATPGAPGRARLLQGVFFAVTEAYKAADDVLMLCLGAEERERGRLEEAKTRFEKVVVRHLVRELEGRTYYLGDRFSAVDIAFAYALVCADFCKEGLLDDPVVKSYHGRLKERAAYKVLYSKPFSW